MNSDLSLERTVEIALCHRIFSAVSVVDIGEAHEWGLRSCSRCVKGFVCMTMAVWLNAYDKPHVRQAAH